MPILSGSEIAERWQVIKAALKLSAAPTADTGEDKLKNILKTLLDGRSICWMSGDEYTPRTVIITTISIEEISGTRNLLIYCAHGFVKESPTKYKELLKSIREYAEAHKCDNILCYAWSSKMVEMFKRYGAECNYTLVVFPLHSKIERRSE